MNFVKIFLSWFPVVAAYEQLIDIKISSLNMFCILNSKKKTLISFEVLPFLLMAPPKRGHKKPRMSRGAALKRFVVQLEVSEINDI